MEDLDISKKRLQEIIPMIQKKELNNKLIASRNEETLAKINSIQKSIQFQESLDEFDFIDGNLKDRLKNFNITIENIEEFQQILEAVSSQVRDKVEEIYAWCSNNR